MIDLRLVRQHPDLVRASQQARGEPVSAVDDLLAADEARRAAVTHYDTIRAEQKSLGKLVARATGDEKAALLAKTKQLAADVKAAEAEQNGADERLREAHLAVPNVIVDGVPPGGEADFTLLREVGTKPSLEEPRDHLDLAEALGAVDMERGAKVSGTRFYFLTGIGAQLQFALFSMALAQALEAGFVPMVTPALVKPEIMGGTGFLGAHAGEVYRLEADDLYLVGTSEVPLAGYHAGEILDLSGGPRRYLGWSSCFRREAGSYGKDTRGIIRVHQFDKVEMFSYCSSDEAQAEHARLLAWEEEMLAKVEVPYRVIDVAAGDLGSSAARKFDCEGWVPSQGRYRELSSASNCTTFQARRLDIRHRDATGRTQPVATLNGTLATTRWLVAILENHQQPDGSVRVPEALRPFLVGPAAGREVLEPIAAR